MKKALALIICLMAMGGYMLCADNTIIFDQAFKNSQVADYQGKSNDFNTTFYLFIWLGCANRSVICCRNSIRFSKTISKHWLHHCWSITQHANPILPIRSWLFYLARPVQGHPRSVQAPQESGFRGIRPLLFHPGDVQRFRP